MRVVRVGERNALAERARVEPRLDRYEREQVLAVGLDDERLEDPLGREAELLGRFEPEGLGARVEVV